mmetsp:Transcript_7291/g.9283  ORF Transcript_7291/g.9283 Transcript_7291/m.9283 type:complete len:200 (+) Transcript_7291:2186-2785(+)
MIIDKQTALDEMFGKSIHEEVNEIEEEEDENERISDAACCLLDLVTQRTANTESKSAAVQPPIDFCKHCEQPKAICEWVVIQKNLKGSLKEGTLFGNYWTGPLPYGTPELKYYKWAALEYYWAKKCGGEDLRYVDREQTPLCIRMGVEFDFLPQSWKVASSAATKEDEPAVAIVTPVKEKKDGATEDDGANDKKRKAEE